MAEDNLKELAISGVKVATIASVFSALFNLGQTAILARFLDAREFGLIAVVFLVYNFTNLFADLGISNAIIYQQKSTHRQLSILYWVNVAIGFLLAGIAIIAAPFIAKFFLLKELTPMIIAIALGFIIYSFGQQYQILLRRDLRFTCLAIVEVCCAFVAFLVVAILAWKNYGAWSLVIAVLVDLLLRTILYIGSGIKQYRPMLIFSLTEIREFLQFGIYQTAEKIIGYFSANFDQVLIGRLMGPEALGIYSLAWRLFSIPFRRINPIFNRVAFPVLSKLQEDKERFNHYFARGMKLLMTAHFSIYIGLLVTAKEVIHLYLGNNWGNVIPIFQILCIYGIFATYINSSGSVLLAKGRVKVTFLWTIIVLLLNFVGIYLIITLKQSLFHVALIRSVISGVSIIVWFMILRKFGEIMLWRNVKNILRSACLASVMGSTVWMMPEFGEGTLVILGVKICLGVAIYSLGVYLFDKETFRFIVSRGTK